MAAMFSTPKMPAVQPAPPPPTLDDPAVQSRADEARRQRAMTGRASQFLSNPMTQLRADPDQRKHLSKELVP